MAEKPEIGATLTLTDATSKTLDKIKEGFGNVNAAADKTTSSLIDIAKTAVGTAIGVNMSVGTGSLVEFGKSAVMRAVEFQQATLQATFLAGAVAKAGTNFDQMRSHAQGFQQELRSISVQTGITGATLNDTFAAVADKMNPVRARITATGQSVLLPMTNIEKGLQRSESQINQLFKDIGNAGRLVAGGPDALAKSFAGFSASSAKASDPIVQMIAATGVLKGNASQVAEQLKMLTDASAMSFAQAAIEKMAKKGKEIPPDFNTTVNQLTTLKDGFVTQFGTPIMKVVVPVVDRLRGTLEQNQAKIQAFVDMLGGKVAKEVEAAAVKVENGFKYILNHSKEIEAAITKGVQTAKDVFTFIVNNKEIIAVAFGAKAVAPLAGMGLAAGKAALPLATSLMQNGIGRLGIEGAGFAGASNAATAGVVALGAFAVAMTAWTAALYNVKKLVDENATRGRLFGGDKEKDQIAREKMFTDTANSLTEVNPEQYAQARKRYIEMEVELGRSGTAAAKFADSQLAIHDMYMKNVREVEEGKKFLDAADGTKLRKASDVPTGLDALSDAYAAQIATMYNNAVKQGNQAAALYAANVIAGSANVQNALINSKSQLEGGFDGLAGVLGDKGADLAQKLKSLAEDAGGKGATPTKPVVQFNNNTFNLKQDFRDQDPDRVALVFRQDIARNAESRRQSKTGGAFGI